MTDTASGTIATGDPRPSPAAHTPGPWRFQFAPYEDGLAFSHVKAGAGNYPDGFRIDTIIGEADARLIAAAPDMLAALKNLVDNVIAFEKEMNYAPNPGCKYCWDATHQAVDAIAKATGSTLGSPVATPPQSQEGVVP